MTRKRDRQVLVNIATGFVRALAALIIFLVVTPYVRAKLGNDLNGLWWLAMSLAGYVALTHVGVGGALTKYVAQARAAGDEAGLRRYVCSGVYLHGLLALVALLVGMILLAVARRMPAITESAFAEEALQAVRVTILAAVINVFFAAIRAVLSGYQRQDACNYMAMAHTVVRAATVVLLLRAGYGLVALSLAYLVLGLIANIGVWLMAGRFCGLSLRRNDFSWQTVGRLLRFAWPNALRSLCDRVSNHTDSLVIGIMISASAVTFFGVGWRLIQFVGELIGSVSGVLMPLASEYSVLQGEARVRKLEELFTRGSRFFTLIVMPPLLFLTVFGEGFIAAWQGEDYEFARTSYLVFLVMVAPRGLGCIQLHGGAMMTGVARHKVLAWLTVLEAAANLGLSIALAPTYGVVGVAWGTAIPMLIKRVVLQVCYKRAFGISMTRYYGKLLRSTGPLIAVYVAVLIVEYTCLAPSRLRDWLVLAVVDMAVFWGAAWFTLEGYERRLLKEFLGRLRMKRES